MSEVSFRSFPEFFFFLPGVIARCPFLRRRRRRFPTTMNSGNESEEQLSPTSPCDYQPISTEEGFIEKEAQFASSNGNSDQFNHLHGFSLQNPNIWGNGIYPHSLQIPTNSNGGVSEIGIVTHENHQDEIEIIEEVGDNEEEEEDEEESSRQISAAFREDESRRNSPLPPGRRSEIVNAMQGITLAGMQPTWADQITEEQWIERLRSLRLQQQQRSNLEN